jgi:hypothetical protein
MFIGMKVVFGALAVSVVIAASACGRAHVVGQQPGPGATKDFVTVHAPSLANLPRAVRKNVKFEIRAAKHPVDPATVNTIEVYGPGTRTALNAAAGGGEGVAPWARKIYYLTVLHGHFVCDSCSRPPGAATPRGSVEWFVWSSPTSGGSDFGLTRKLPRAVSRLHRLIRIRLVRLGRL